MSSVRTDTIGGFNTFLQEQKKTPGEATITLTQFDNEYEVVYALKKIADAPELTIATFVPRGSTALLDAIGRTINEAGASYSKMAEADRPERVIVVILTDGQENASHEFTRDQIFKMVKEQRENWKWEFFFVGANQDAIQAGMSIGISGTKSMNYCASAVGTQNTFKSLSHSASSYRVAANHDMAVATSDFSDDDRKEAMKS